MLQHFFIIRKHFKISAEIAMRKTKSAGIKSQPLSSTSLNFVALSLSANSDNPVQRIMAALKMMKIKTRIRFLISGFFCAEELTMKEL